MVVGGTCQVTNECHHHVLVAMVHGEQGVQLLAVVISVLKSGPVQSFCLFWRRPDRDRLRRFQIFFGLQPN